MKRVLVLALLVCVACAMESGKDTDTQKRRMAAVGPKDLDMKKLEGKWHVLASSAAISKDFAKGCECGTIDLKSAAENKLNLRAGCRNATTSKYSYVEGIMTQVKPKENKSLFHLKFTEAKGIKHVKTEGKTAADEKGKEGAGKEGAKDVNLDVNTVILKTDKDYRHVLFGSPQLDSAFIISRDQKIDDNLYKEYVKFLEQNGFTSSRLKKVECKASPAGEKP